jgi:hypothetical protein
MSRDTLFASEEAPSSLLASAAATPGNDPSQWRLVIRRPDAPPNRRGRGVRFVLNWATARRHIAHESCKLYLESFYE